MFYFRAKKLNITTGEQLAVVMINEEEAIHLGIRAGDKLVIGWNSHKIICEANLTEDEVPRGYIGLYEEIWKHFPIPEEEGVALSILSRPDSINAIRKKLLGKDLSFDEINSIIRDIANHRLSHTEIAYFVASGFVREYSNQELYYLVKAMAENGEQIKFHNKMVVDKHSIGGMATKKITMLVTPIVAAAGVLMPKTSSRAITSPAGTADTMEVIAQVSFSAKEIKEIVKKNNGCIVWGGGLSLVPADDRIIKVSYPLSIEPYTKAIVSIMAKKVAMGIKYLVIDMPVGKDAKVTDMRRAKHLEKIFLFISRKFGIKTKVLISRAKEPIGQGNGPALEVRDVLRVLQRKENRPMDLEKKTLLVAGTLLEIAGKAKKGKGSELALKILDSGQAWKKMKNIIKSQKGNPHIDSETVTQGALKEYVTAKKNGTVRNINGKMLNDICRTLGNPNEKLAGVFLNKKVGDKIKKGDRICTLYAQSEDRMKLAIKSLGKMDIFTIK